MHADNTPDLTPERIAAQTTMTPAQFVYLMLAVLSVSSLLIADIIGVKLFQLDLPGWTVVHTCGMLPFPITFLITDLVNEYFGKKAARRIVWIGLVMGLFVFAVVNVSLRMDYYDRPFNVKKEYFEAIFSSSQIMYVSSLVAYLVGNLSDIMVFAWIKRITKGRYVWLRATGSTVVSQVIDSFVVTWLAFNVGPSIFRQVGKEIMPMPEVLNTAATGYTLKFVLAFTIIPLIYLGRVIIHKRYGLVPLPPERA